MRRHLLLLPILALAIAAIGFALPASAEETSGPLIFQMADGKFYDIRSGRQAETREALLKLLNVSAPVEQDATTPAPVVTEEAQADTRFKDAITRGRAMLQARIDQAKAAGKTNKVVSSCPASVFVTIAAWNEQTGTMKKIIIRKQGMKADIYSTEVSTSVSVRRDNGVNSDYYFSDPNLVIAAVDYTVCKRLPSGSYELEDVVYTPYSSKIHRPEIVAWGEETLDGFIDGVYDTLRSNGVRSKTYPDRLLADVIDPDLVKSIIVIEHVGHNSILNGDTARVIESVYVVLAANQDDAYDYSRSSAGATGLVQFIPSTYELIKRNQGLELIADFVTAMTTPSNAIKAAVGYLDAELDYMPLAVQDLYHVDKRRVNEILAASYNGGGVRVRRAVMTWGDGWSDPQDSYSLRPETVLYVQKFRATIDLIKPPLITAWSQT